MSSKSLALPSLLLGLGGTKFRLFFGIKSNFFEVLFFFEIFGLFGNDEKPPSFRQKAPLAPGLPPPSVTRFVHFVTRYN